MIRHLRHKEIDTEKWDECIKTSANGRIYAFSWYLDSAAESQWDALIEDDYQVVCPLPFRRKFRISYVYTPFFIQQLGIFSRHELSPEVLNNFLKAIPSLFKLTELNLNSGNKPDTTEFTYIKNRNLELNLYLPYNLLRNQYSENLKRNLKKSKGENIAVTPTESPDQLITLFRNERGRTIKHWGDQEYRRFKALTELCGEKERTCILSAFDQENGFIAGAVFFMTEDRAILIFSATGSKAKAGGAMAAIIDFFIREHAGKPMILDFEGSNDPGLARFYAGFGAAEKAYYRAIRNHLPFYVNIALWLKKSRV